MTNNLQYLGNDAYRQTDRQTDRQMNIETDREKHRGTNFIKLVVSEVQYTQLCEATK